MLFNYSNPNRARRTLAKLRSKWPQNRFDVVLSASMSYAFRYVIRCILPDGRAAYVERAKIR